MAGPAILGIRDVKNPFKGLQDTVTQAGSIYQQFERDRLAAEQAEAQREAQRDQTALGLMRAQQDRDTLHETRRFNQYNMDRGKKEDERADTTRQILQAYNPNAIYSDTSLLSDGARSEFESRYSGLLKDAERYNLEVAPEDRITQDELEQLRTATIRSLALRGRAQKKIVNDLIAQGVDIKTATEYAQGMTTDHTSREELQTDIRNALTAEQGAAQQRSIDSRALLASLLAPTSDGGTFTTAGSTGGLDAEELKKVKETYKGLIGKYNGTDAAAIINEALVKVNLERATTPGNNLPQLTYDDVSSVAGGYIDLRSVMNSTFTGDVDDLTKAFRDVRSVVNTSPEAAERRNAQAAALQKAVQDLSEGRYATLPTFTAAEQARAARIFSSNITDIRGRIQKLQDEGTYNTALQMQAEAQERLHRDAEARAPQDTGTGYSRRAFLENLINPGLQPNSEEEAAELQRYLGSSEAGRPRASRRGGGIESTNDILLRTLVPGYMPAALMRSRRLPNPE